MVGREKEAAIVSRRSFLAGAAALGAVSALGFAGCAPASEKGSDAGASVEGDAVVATGSGAGRMGDIMVKMSLVGSTITGIEVIKQHETPMIANSALSRIPELVIRNQLLDVDAVAGATITSFGLKAAIEDALANAGLSKSDLAKTGSDSGILVEEPIEADIAVVGGGLTGLVATARALQNGKKVVLFEETAHLGGSSCVSDGWITGADTIMERAEGVEDSAEQFYAFLTQGSDDPAIVPYPENTRKYAEMAGPVLDWLDTYANVDFGDRAGGYGLYTPPDQPRIYGVNNGGGALDMALIQLIQDGIRDGNASVVLEARATSILKDESGAVSGLEITYADSTVREYAFKAVVLATGGYSHNEEMMPYENCGTCSPSTASGHGFELAEAAGANMLPPEIYAPYAGGIPNAGFEMRYQANLKLPGEIWVNQEGARMANEDYPLLAKAAWGKASGNIGFVVFSEAQLVEGLRPIVMTSYLEGELTPWQSRDLLDELVAEGDVAWKADSASELAKAAGIDGALAETLEAYAGYCDAGEDPDFGRTKMQKLEGALYAIKTIPYQLQCTGGARVDPSAAVLDEKDEPIAGLFAGGEAIGMRQSSAGGQGGCGLGNAATWGYIAADSASEYVS